MPRRPRPPKPKRPRRPGLISTGELKQMNDYTDDGKLRESAPVEAIHGIGKKSAANLKKKNIMTVKDYESRTGRKKHGNLSNPYEVKDVEVSSFKKHTDVAKELDELKSYAKANDFSEVPFSEYNDSDKEGASSVIAQERNSTRALQNEFLRNTSRSDDEAIKLYQEFIKADREFELLIRKYEGRELYSEAELEKAMAIFEIQDKYNLQLVKDHQSGSYRETGIMEKEANRLITDSFPEGTPAYLKRDEQLDKISEYVNSRSFNAKAADEWLERVDMVKSCSWRDTAFCSNEETGRLHAKAGNIEREIKLKEQQAVYDEMPGFITAGKLYDKDIIRQEIQENNVEKETFDVENGKVDFLEPRDISGNFTTINGINTRGKLKKGKKIRVEYNMIPVSAIREGKLYRSDSGKYYLVTDLTDKEIQVYSFKGDLRAKFIFNADEKARQLAVIDDEIAGLRSQSRSLKSNIDATKGNQLGGLGLMMEGSSYHYAKNKDKIAMLRERKKEIEMEM